MLEAPSSFDLELVVDILQIFQADVRRFLYRQRWCIIHFALLSFAEPASVQSVYKLMFGTLFESRAFALLQCNSDASGHTTPSGVVVMSA